LSTKEELLKDWIKFKKLETKNKIKREEIEVEIEKEYGEFEKKSKTFNDKELGYKTNISKNIYVKLDQDMYKSIRNDIPAELRPEKIIFELDSKGYKWLEENKEEIYKKVSDCVTVTPGKTTVKVEKIK